MNHARDIYDAHIKSTSHKSVVPIVERLLCNLRNEICVVLRCNSTKVHVTSKAIKHIHDRHIYDKKVTYTELELIIDNLLPTLEKPDEVYENLPNRRGHFVFLKTAGRHTFFVVTEKIDVPLPGNIVETINYVVTAFLLIDKSYLNGLKLLWVY